MAKTEKTEATEAATLTVGAFTFDVAIPIPAASSRGRSGGSELAAKLAAMPVGASFLEPVTVPDTTAANERDAVFSEKARAKANSVSGVIRRFCKSEAGTGKAFKAVTVNDDAAGRGIRVWRIEPVAKPAA